MIEQLDQGQDIVFRPVCCPHVVAALHEQKSLRSGLKAELPPRYICHCAAPRHRDMLRQELLHKGPVECRVHGNHPIAVFEELGQLTTVDGAPGQIGIGQAGQLGDLVRKGFARIYEPGHHALHRDDPPLLVDQDDGGAKFNDLVFVDV